jgi:hypothetical protein
MVVRIHQGQLNLRKPAPVCASQPSRNARPTRPVCPVSLTIDRLANLWRLRGVTLSVWIRLTTLSYFLHDHFMKAELDCGTVHLRVS